MTRRIGFGGGDRESRWFGRGPRVVGGRNAPKSATAGSDDGAARSSEMASEQARRRAERQDAPARARAERAADQARARSERERDRAAARDDRRGAAPTTASPPQPSAQPSPWASGRSQTSSRPIQTTTTASRSSGGAGDPWAAARRSAQQRRTDAAASSRQGSGAQSPRARAPRAVRRPGLLFPFVWLALLTVAAGYLGLLVYTNIAIDAGLPVPPSLNDVYLLLRSIGLPITFLSEENLVIAMFGLGVVALLWLRALIGFLARLGRLAS